METKGGIKSNLDIVQEYFTAELLNNIGNVDIIRAFRVTNPKDYLSEKDYNIWKTLPDYVEVYRGCKKEELEELGVPLGISYTLSPKVAEWFANRCENGCVVKMVIPKEYIRCYYNGRKEEEVIILGCPLEEVSFI